MMRHGHFWIATSVLVLASAGSASAAETSGASSPLAPDNSYFFERRVSFATCTKAKTETDGADRFIGPFQSVRRIGSRGDKDNKRIYIFRATEEISDESEASCKQITHIQEPVRIGETFYLNEPGTKMYESGGFEVGPMVIPIKVQLTKGGDVTTGATTVGYVGYRLDYSQHWIGIAAIPVLFVGVAANLASSGSDQTTGAGLSYGGGLLFTVSDTDKALNGSKPGDYNIRFGPVFGFDHVSSTPKYKYSDKPWLGFTLGIGF